MDYKKRIRNSGISFKIESIAKQVFSQWLENARRVHNLSHELYEQIRNDKVGDTFLNHLVMAIRSLVENESEEKNSIQGWSFNYVCGHLQGSLDIEWINKYVIEQSEEYEDLMKIKAVIEYFHLGNTTSIEEIFSMYKYFLEQRIQPTEPVEVNTRKVVSIFKHNDSNQAEKIEFKKSVIDILSNELEFKFFELMNEMTHSTCCPSLTEYLDIQDIENIAGDEQFV